MNDRPYYLSAAVLFFAWVILYLQEYWTSWHVHLLPVAGVTLMLIGFFRFSPYVKRTGAKKRRNKRRDKEIFGND